jgi:hypothetical protein
MAASTAPQAPGRRLVVSIGLLLSLVAGCSTTVNETGDNVDGAGTPTPLDGEAIVDSTLPEPVLPVVGTASELLPEIGVDMSRLGTQIASEGGQDETLARIEANWAAIRAEIERDRPELVGSIQVTVDMARTAVERKRPADADKAFSILRDLIDSFTGDS